MLLEQYGRFKKAELEESPFRCLLNANIEINPHQINAFCAAIQALKTGGIVLADEVGLGKTIEAGLTLKYVLDSGAKHVLIALPATLRKQWEVELEEKFNLQASILDRLTVESNLSFWKACLENRDEVRIVITSYDYSSKLMQRFSNVKWDFIIIDEAHNLRNVFHGTKRAKRLYELSKGIPKILLTATPLQNSLSDLHGLISFIDPRIFGSEKVFNKRFIEGQDRVCSRDGYVAIGEEHKRHNRTQELPASTLTPIRPFLPPELIIQDELHLITGPLGTVYGAYETIIEDMCTYGDKRIKPKYVVSTATIKNASEQTRCLYARQSTAQFPPNGFEIGDSFFINEISTKDDPFRKYVGVCAPGQSVKTTLLRMYAIILQTSYQLAQRDEYKNVIDPYYSLVGYYNSIRELGGAVRLLQDDIPKRIYRIKTKYNMDKVRYLNKKVEITSRMSSYEIPNKLRQLEATCDSKDCLDTAVATNMIAVGMDVDRLGLMVVTGQPKQNSEYIQATSRIGRAFPGLVFTLYNPYRPRDLSHYENFTGYHSQLYRFVEGTTATPFSARARDRVMHALIISAIRLKYPEMASNEKAADIAALSDIQMSEIKALILDRLNIVKPEVRLDAENEIDQFIDWWKMLAAQGKPLRYYVYGTDKYNRLMNYYGQSCKDTEKATLSSMREVENAANMFYYTEE